jgi:hypothetical protein
MHILCDREVRNKDKSVEIIKQILAVLFIRSRQYSALVRCVFNHICALTLINDTPFPSNFIIVWTGRNNLIQYLRLVKNWKSFLLNRPSNVGGVPSSKLLEEKCNNLFQIGCPCEFIPQMGQ